MSFFGAAQEVEATDALQEWRSAAPLKPGESRADQLDAALAAASTGVDQTDLQSALGAPDNDFDREWIYTISIDLFGRDYQYLLVVFDENNVVIRAEQVSGDDYVSPARR